MSWEEANKIMDAGGVVTLPEGADTEYLMKTNGIFYAVTPSGHKIEINNLYDYIKKRTDWEEVK